MKPKVDNTSDTYNKIADKYAAMYFHDKADVPYIDKFLSYLDKKGKVLDIGCGVGNFSQYMHGQGFEVVGIDLSEKMLEIAAERVKGVDFKYMDMRDLEFHEGIFDGILSAYSLIHIPSDEITDTLKEFNRVLNTKGKALIIVHKGEKDKIVDGALMDGEKVFINFFQPAVLVANLKEAGFDVLFEEVKRNPDLESMSEELICIVAEKTTNDK